MAEDIEEFQRRAEAFNNAFDAEDWDKAIEFGEALRAEFPNSFDADEWNTKNLASAYYNRGGIYLGLEKYEQAIEDYSKAIEIEPEDASAYYNRGVSYAGLELYEQAIEDSNKAIEIKPGKEVLASAHNNRGNNYLGLKQYERAIADYDKAIALKPDKEVLAIAYFNRGNSYNGLKQYERAIEDYDKALEINSDYAEAYNNRGNCYGLLKHFDDAIKDYNQAIKRAPTAEIRAGAYNGRGNSYLGLEEYEQAIADYNKAIELDPENKMIYDNRALTIGRQEAEKATQKIKESYEKQLSSITDPIEIDKRFRRRRKASERRLRRFRKFTGGLFILLIFATPILWFYVSGEIDGGMVGCTEANCDNFGFITKHISISVTTILLLSPLIAALSYCNRNARIERHTQEDYYRKSVMLLLSRPEGDNIQTLMEHLDKHGTPEVLNKLYHPKHASKPPDNTPILKRIESLLSKTPRKEGTDG